jgi:hypothetical protein
VKMIVQGLKGASTRAVVARASHLFGIPSRERDAESVPPCSVLFSAVDDDDYNDDD